MKKVIFLSLSFISVFADDLYVLKYDHVKKQCELTKNGKTIPFFDKKFKRLAPRNHYTCFSLQKEQYNDCKIVDKKNITAMYYGYGSYEATNAIISFKNPSPTVDSYVKVQCTKHKPYQYPKSNKN